MCLLSCARNYLGVVFFIFSFVRISNTLVSNSGSFSQNEACKFVLNNGEVIDLSPLLNYNQPLLASTNTSLYIYHPCTDVPLQTSPVNECSKSYGLCFFLPKNPTAAPIDFNKVILNEIPGNFTVLAFNGEAVFRQNAQNHPEIVFKHYKNETYIITTIIQLQCDEKVANHNLIIGKTSVHEHALTLSSRYVCVQTPHYMSGGTVFFIILLVFIILYFVGGILVLRFIRGATGIEMIPNHEFWCSLPQMAKNGFKYLTNCGKNTPDSYEKI